MENIVPIVKSKVAIKSAILDAGALLFIYLVPALSHLFNIPLYLLEPMRIMLVLSMAHSGKMNNFIIALTLPLFSLLISTHPALVKTGLITTELFINVGLFYFLSKKIQNSFIAMFISIMISKMVYYSLKFVLIQTALMNGDMVATPIVLQIVMTFIFSLYIYLISQRTEKKA